MKTRECKSRRMCIALMLTNYFATCYTLFVDLECFIRPPPPSVWIKVWHTCSSRLAVKCKLMNGARWFLRVEKTFKHVIINKSLRRPAPKRNLIANLINAFTFWTAASQRLNEWKYFSQRFSTNIIHLISAVCYETRYDIYKIINRLYGNANSRWLLSSLGDD